MQSTTLELKPDQLQTRIEEDIDFINMLSNPYYIEFLINQKYFEDEAFINYLSYLEYLKDERMLKFIRYPISVKMLENIQNPEFIQMWKVTPNFTNDMNDQLFAHSVFMSKCMERLYKSGITGSHN